MRHKKILAALAASAMLAGGFAMLTFATPVQAADGDQFFVNGDFSSPTVNGLLNTPNTTTSFNLGDGTLGYSPGNGSMYDPGRYIIASNPNSVHSAWATFPEGDPKLIANGFTEGTQTVLSQNITLPDNCATGSSWTLGFSMEATNVLPLDYGGGVPGANISVNINGVETFVTDLTTSDPNAVVSFQTTVPYVKNTNVSILNNGTAYSGNDFALDNIRLYQVGECEPPCEPTVTGVWHNYTGKYTGTGTPALTDPKWHAVAGTPNGQHALSLRGLDKPYQPGADKGKGDWFVWKTALSGCDQPGRVI